MKALTLWQPHAGLISLGLKTIETRGWRTNYRGPLAIHAGRSFDHEYWGAATSDGWIPYHHSDQVPELTVRGVFLCVVDVVEVRPMVESDEEPACCSCPPPGAETRYAWVLGNVRRCDPAIPAVGHQGLWDTDLIDVDGKRYSACLSTPTVVTPPADPRQVRIPGT